MAAPDPKTVLDTALATGMVSTPIWLQLVEQGLQIFMLVGGSLLLIVRLWMMLKNRGNKKNG